MVMVIDEAPAGSKGRACVYSRVSNPNDTREHSLESQEERTAAILRKMGYTVGPDDIFRERHTGTEYDRPVLNRVRDLIALGTYQAIGFYAMDRISRSQVHTAILFDEFDRAGVLPVSATEDISDNSPEGKLIRSIRAYVAEVERIKILDRTARAREKLRANRQMLMSSRAKLGYRYDKQARRRVIDPDEQKIVLLIFEWCATGVACNAIAKRLTEQGVANSTARRGYKNRTSFSAWSGSTIQTIIRDKTYLGWTIENRYQLVKNPKHKDGVTEFKGNKIVERPEEEWVILDKSGEITPPIVSESLWEQANRELTLRINNRQSTYKPHSTSEHLLRGILYCKVCGSKCYTYCQRTKNINSYRCSTHHSVKRRSHLDLPKCAMRRVEMAWADAVVWDEFKALIVTPGRLEDAIRRLTDTGDEPRIRRDIEAARAQLRKKEDLRSKLYAKWRAELEKDEEFAASLEADYRALKGPIDAFRDMIRELETRLAAMADSPKAADGFRRKFEHLRDRMIDGDQFTFAEKFEALRLAGTRIEGNGDELDISFNVFSDSVATPTVSPRG